MLKKYCYDKFTDEYLDYIKKHGVCDYCRERGTVTEFVIRHERLIAKCSRYTCRGEIWAGYYLDAYKGYSGGKSPFKSVTTEELKSNETIKCDFGKNGSDTDTKGAA